jgi:hypothetical protein
MRVKIRKDLGDKFEFSTDCGIQIDNDEEYFARYIHENIFQIYISNRFRIAESIDFDIIEEEFFTDEMHNTIFVFQPQMGSKYSRGEQITTKKANKLNA